MVKVSIITPTYERHHFHARLRDCVLAQTCDDIEWLVLDDSTLPSPVLTEIADPRLRYVHDCRRRSIGAKRNALVAMACGEIIVHVDDDDYYSPDYVATMVDTISGMGADFINLRGWFLFDRRAMFLGYWDLTVPCGAFHVCDGIGVELVVIDDPTVLAGTELGWGFGFAYRRTVWEAIGFPDQDFDEDGAFSRAAHARFRCGYLLDRQGLCLHEVHGGNTSRAFAQSNVPIFLLPRLFPDYRMIESDV